MSIVDWLMVFAVLFGLVIAIQLTRYLYSSKEIRERKIMIFRTLMATRAYIISSAHVEALNRIDLEFDDRNKKEKAVISAWKEYLDLLSDSSINSEQWGIKRVDLLVKLLHKMAQVLNYDFDKTHVKNSCYGPMVHSVTEDENTALRRSLLQVLEGKRSVPINLSDMQKSEK